MRLVIEAAQLEERLGMIVDAEIEPGILLAGMDQERCRLLAALVAARRLPGRQRANEPLGERLLGRGPVGGDRRRDHLRSRQHVAGDREPVRDGVPAPIDAVGAGMRRRCGRSTSITWSWREPRPASPAISVATTSAADLPSARRRNPFGPKVGFTSACVEMAPTPPCAWGQSEPTAKNLVVTATPKALVAGSRATIDQVTAAAPRVPSSPAKI